MFTKKFSVQKDIISKQKEIEREFELFPALHNISKCLDHVYFYYLKKEATLKDIILQASLKTGLWKEFLEKKNFKHRVHKKYELLIGEKLDLTESRLIWITVKVVIPFIWGICKYWNLLMLETSIIILLQEICNYALNKAKYIGQKLHMTVEIILQAA
ncbi:unnamed protein product [Blepharisma stoltei]|uniref:Uncharacterized protein n=1 Tax=Blepharisma stoltei TaxID=1481888 RepID=A0AAU9IVR3_9CILI|nr:unnamed protein product [Blepharisma stoltei]